MRTLFLIVLLLVGITAYGQHPIVCDPATLEIRGVPVGKEDSAFVMLTNVIDSAVTSIMFSVEGADGGYFTLPFYLPKLESHQRITVPVAFMCTRPGVHYADVIIYGYVGDAAIPERVGTFSIVANADTTSVGGISPVYQAVNFGTLSVGEELSQAFTLMNTSPYEMPVTFLLDGLTIRLEDVSERPIPSVLTLAPYETITIIATCAPSTPGLIQEYLFVLWNESVSAVEFSANVVNARDLSITWFYQGGGVGEVRDHPGDFVAESIGKTTSWTARITNNTPAPRTIFVSLAGMPTGTPFSIANALQPLTLNGYDSLFVRVDYVGHGTDPFFDAVLISDESTLFYVASVVGYVLPAPSSRLQLSTVQGRPGSTDTLRMVLSEELSAFIGAADITLTFNASVLVPLFPVTTDVTENGKRTILTRFDVVSREAGTSVAGLPFAITLGDAQRSEIRVDALQWLDGNGGFMPQLTQVINGTVIVNDERAVNANAGSIVLQTSPTPASSHLVVNYQGTQGSVTVELYDLTGLRLLSTQGSAMNGSGSVTIDCSIFASGTYAVRVSDPFNTSVRRIIIE